MGACASVASSVYRLEKASEQPLMECTSVLLPLPKPRDTSIDVSRRKSNKDIMADTRGAGSHGNLSEQLVRFSVSQEHPWLLKRGTIPSREAGNMTPSVVLGKGYMATVRLTRWKTGERRLFLATKAVKKKFIAANNEMRHITSELQALRGFESPFIVSLFGTFQDAECVYFMLEYCAGGDAYRMLQQRKRFSEDEALFVASEALLAVEYIHKSGFVYRDLKPENIMFDVSGHVKLVDFSFVTKPDKKGLCMTLCGTPAYLSPEMINVNTHGGYTKAVDWWAFGCLVFELLVGRAPFSEKATDTPAEIYPRVVAGTIRYPGILSHPARDLIAQLLKSNMNNRLVEPSLIKTHDFFAFNGFNWEDVAAQRLRPPFVPLINTPGDASVFSSENQAEEKQTTPFRPLLTKTSETSNFAGF